MRKGSRRTIFAWGLTLLGIALVLSGSAVSLGYVDLPGATRATPAEAPQERAVATGVEADARIALDTPLARTSPVTIELEPAPLSGMRTPGLSVDRDIGVEQAGVGIAADLEVASGSHRTKSAGEDATLSTSSTTILTAPPAVSAAAAAAAFTLAGALAYFWPTLKTWLARFGIAPALLLYAKISRAEVFDNGVRERIFRSIRANPGVSASDLARLADVSWGTTIYHLDVLEQTRMVTSIRKGRYRRYFENGAALTVSKDVLAVMQNPVTAQVVQTLRAAPGVTQKELAGATQMTPQALHWHLARLVSAGVVRKEREGRVVRHFVS